MVVDGWKIVNIGQDCTLKARIGWQGLTVQEYKDNGNYFLVTGTDFDNGFVDWDTCHYVDKWRYTQDKNIQLKTGDVLITKDGTIGKVGYIENLRLPATLNSGVFVVRPKSNDIFPKYLYYVFTSKIFESFLNRLTAGSTINHLYQKDFVSFDFHIPELSEQKAIATALSDVDELITTLTTLIAKKEDIKTATMQQLLTGKKRLDGFSGKWGERIIQDIATVKGGKRLPKGRYLLNTKTRYPYIKVADMYFGGVALNAIQYVPEDVYPSIQNYTISINDLFISVAGTLGVVGKIPKELNGANLTENANKLTNIKCDIDFLFYMMCSPLIQNYIESSKTTGAQPKLALTRIENFIIPLPEEKNEQIAIAKILSDMDKELETLKTKLEKTKAIKTGMMQELLTGKTRLLRGAKNEHP